MGLTSGGCPHDITDSYRLKMTLKPSSGVMSVVCWHAFGLAKYLDTLTDGGGVLPTPECGNPNPYGMVCVVGLLCGGCYVWTHVTRFLECPDLPVTSAYALDLNHECVLAYQRALVHQIITCRFWLVSLTSMTLIACHPSLSLSRKSWPHNTKSKKSENGTPRVFQQLGACTF